MTGHAENEMKKGNTGILHSSWEKVASGTAKKAQLHCPETGKLNMCNNYSWMNTMNSHSHTKWICFDCILYSSLFGFGRYSSELVVNGG